MLSATFEMARRIRLPPVVNRLGSPVNAFRRSPRHKLKLAKPPSTFSWVIRLSILTPLSPGWGAG